VSWLPAIAWAGVIFAFSAQPNLRFVPDAGLDFIVRKAGHMGVFGILALLAWWALARTATWRWPWAWALGVSVLYAMTDEFHQGFVAGRHPSVVDVSIDGTGAVIAVVVVSLIRQVSKDTVRATLTGLDMSPGTESLPGSSAEVGARRQRDALARLEFPDLTSETLAAIRAPRRFDRPVGNPTAPDEKSATPDKPSPPIGRAP